MELRGAVAFGEKPEKGMVEGRWEGMAINPGEKASEKDEKGSGGSMSPSGIGDTIRAGRGIGGLFEGGAKVIKGKLKIEGGEWNSVSKDLLGVGK